MHAAGHAYDILSPAELDRIHRSALRILGEMGMEVQNAALLALLAEAGFKVDPAIERVYFPQGIVETFLSQASKYDWTNHTPTVSASAGVYHGLYHDPRTDALVPWDEAKLKSYFALARSLDHVGAAHMLGCRISAPGHVPGLLEPLYERYYCWKHGTAEGGSIFLDEVCPYLLDLYEMRASALGVPTNEAFKATVYLVPALKLGRHEAYQIMYFRGRGLRVRIGGSMLTMGADAPVTLAGAVTLNLAEQLALNLLDWALWDDLSFSLSASIAPLDMRTTIRPFGRPEMAVANLMTAQMARCYGASFSGHAGLSDAKLPSPEAGAQKALSGVATLMAGGSLWLDAGLLGVDEVCSPVQLVLDNEFLSALKRFTHEFRIDDETIALDLILATGPGGGYLDRTHTARHFREELWEPSIWSRRMLQSWLAEEGGMDVERARQIALAARENPPDVGPGMDEAFERRVLDLIDRAGREILA